MYFIMRIKTASDGSVSKSVYDHTNYQNALKQYFSVLSADIGDITLQSNLCMLISATGNVMEQRYFDHASEE